MGAGCRNDESTKTRIETPMPWLTPQTLDRVVMTNPLKQGLKLGLVPQRQVVAYVVMTNPLKQGLKQIVVCLEIEFLHGRNDESTKTRIETINNAQGMDWGLVVVMTNPLKQGLKLRCPG